jgi:hypothetical protein
MADEVKATEAEIQEARSMGWADESEWRGKPEDFVDARTFLARGRQIMPILQKHNERLSGQLTQLSGKLTSLETALQAANATIEALEQSRDEDIAEQVRAARAQLKAELATASREGNHEAVAELTDKLTQLNTAGDAAEEEIAGKKPPAPSAKEISPEIKEWYAQNSDFVGNKHKVALGSSVAEEMRIAGDARTGAAFLDAVRAEVEKILGGTSRGAPSKVAGGNGGGGRSGSGDVGADKTYADLPAEAKAACDRMALRLVGPNRKHKDVASWRASYVAQFFKDQP